MADKVTPCHICGNIARRVCKLCGRPACDRHLDDKTGICVSHSLHKPADMMRL